VDHVDTSQHLEQLASQHLEQLAGQMRRASVAGGRHAELARIGLSVSDEFGNGLGWNRWVHGHYVGHPEDACDWRDVADEIEVEPVEERDVDRRLRVDHEKCVAVRRCARDYLSGDIAGRARPVFDNKLLTEPIRKPLGHQTREKIGPAAGGKADDDAHGPRRIILRPGSPRDDRKRGSTRCKMQNVLRRIMVASPEIGDASRRTRKVFGGDYGAAMVGTVVVRN
jgi:hypothetical protein